MPLNRHPDDSLPAAQRHAVVAAILALHAVAGWGLLQVQAVREAIAGASPLFVDLLTPPAPERPPEPPAPPPPLPRPVPKRPPPPAPVVATPAPVPEPAAFVVPAPDPEPTPPPAPLVQAALPAPPPAAPAPAPQEIPPSAVEYLVLPQVSYPHLSRRLNESGLVVVTVYVGTDGLPQRVQLAQSSGHARLDDAALAGVRRARFKPPTLNGRPIEGWARIPIPFELE